MISFENDYSEGMTKEILDEVVKENTVQVTGYGLDKYCKDATKLIKKAINRNDVDIHFIPGGTPCNLLAASLLKPYEGIICADTGHINVHETGAIENTGHKCLSIKVKDGKLTPSAIQEVFDKHTDEHMVKPAMVFVSNSTEVGTTYSKKELTAISKLCKKLDLILYLDGARIGSAITSKGCDLTLSDFANLCDMFYIGGTKNGAIIGEAMIIVNDKLKENFRYLLKNKGLMLAKSRLLGISFKVLFKDDLYFKLASHANDMAMLLKKCFKETNTKFHTDSNTNQQFVILDNKVIKKLQKKYVITVMDPIDKNHHLVRFVTSWWTPIENVNAFIKDYKSIA